MPPRAVFQNHRGGVFVVKHPRFIVVGAGITGLVLAERIASVLGERVLVLESRSKIGGNSRAEIDPDTGIEVHVYGSHIFHTTDKVVWDYVRKFTDFNDYRHRVFLRSVGRVYTMPIDLKTVNDFYGAQFSPDEARAFLAEEIRKEGIGHPKNLEEKAVSLVGRGLYDRMIRGYTAKQWGRGRAVLEIGGQSPHRNPDRRRLLFRPERNSRFSDNSLHRHDRPAVRRLLRTTGMAQPSL